LGRSDWSWIGKEEIYFFYYSDVFYRGFYVTGLFKSYWGFIDGSYEGKVIFEIGAVVREITSELIGCFLKVLIF
jgi:hypothetical protein